MPYKDVNTVKQVLRVMYPPSLAARSREQNHDALIEKHAIAKKK